MLGFYKNSISRIVVVWWATEMPDGENRLKSKKKSTTTENEKSHGAARLRGPVINQSHHSPLQLPSSFFFLPPFLSRLAERAGEANQTPRFLFLFLFSFLTVIIIATKLLSYSYSFVSLFFFLFSFPLINGLV
jgi:Flp pilus assembly protein TadB